MFMNEIEQLEKELESLRPMEASSDFEHRVEKALGDCGHLAVSQLPDLVSEDRFTTASRGKLLLFSSVFLLGSAAVITLLFSSPSFSPSESGPEPRMPLVINIPSTPTLSEDSPSIGGDSPIHGVSAEEFSAMTNVGWGQAQAQQIPIDFSDEGIVDRPGMNPARLYRYQYMDETIWVNPETNTFIRSSVPRQETLLIGLEPF
jgi:hypothetical protein